MPGCAGAEYADLPSRVRITTDRKSGLKKRLLWFAGIYAASVAAFAAISFLLEMLLPK
jgi:hypothetical protein